MKPTNLKWQPVRGNETFRRRDRMWPLPKDWLQGVMVKSKNMSLSHWTRQARECTRQLDVRRFRLEGALEDLRRRTLENERLEAQATTMRGEGEALRELADARGLESTDLREKLARCSFFRSVRWLLKYFSFSREVTSRSWMTTFVDQGFSTNNKKSI